MKLVNGIAILEDDLCISRFVQESGRLDHDQSVLPRVLKHIPVGGTVIDVGAFIGDHTIAYARKTWIKGRVYAFEPNPRAYECLSYNLAPYSNTVCMNKGAGREPGTISMVDVETNGGMCYAKSGGDIEVIAIDSLNLTRLDYMKIDCEGYELEVLLGAENTIDLLHPAMLIEINEMTLIRAGITRLDIYGWLDTHGYKYANIYPEFGLDEYQMDILCL